jgi:hypothetical protein
MMNSYTFPFNSCEIPQTDGIAQPYSTSVNLLLCLIILYFLQKSTNVYSRVFLTSILIFNAFHTFSHTIHINLYKNLQFLLTHFSAIASTIAFLFLLHFITKKALQTWQICTLVLFYLIDVGLIFLNVSHIYNITVFLIILFSILLFYYPSMPKVIQKNVWYIIGFSCIVLTFRIFEILNCQFILREFQGFPFHTLTEISATIPIFLLCYSFH